MRNDTISDYTCLEISVIPGQGPGIYEIVSNIDIHDIFNCVIYV